MVVTAIVQEVIEASNHEFPTVEIKNEEPAIRSEVLDLPINQTIQKDQIIQPTGRLLKRIITKITPRITKKRIAITSVALIAIGAATYALTK